MKTYEHVELGKLLEQLKRDTAYADVAIKSYNFYGELLEKAKTYLLSPYADPAGTWLSKLHITLAAECLHEVLEQAVADDNQQVMKNVLSVGITLGIVFKSAVLQKVAMTTDLQELLGFLDDNKLVSAITECLERGRRVQAYRYCRLLKGEHMVLKEKIKHTLLTALQRPYVYLEACMYDSYFIDASALAALEKKAQENGETSILIYIAYLRGDKEKVQELLQEVQDEIL